MLTNKIFNASALTLPATAGLRIFASIIMLTKNNPMNS